MGQKLLIESIMSRYLHYFLEKAYHICPNRSAVHKCKGLGARLLISTIKPVIRYLQNAYIYGKQELHGPLFTRKWRFAYVRQLNRLEYRSNFSVFGRSCAVISRIWCEFDVMCFLLQGRAHLGHHRVCACIRTYSDIWYVIWNVNCC